MTKRVLGIFLVACVLIGLCACGKEVSEYVREHGQISLEIIEDYLEGNISDDTAMTKLKVQEDLIHDHCDQVESDTGKFPYKDDMVALKIGSCWNAVFSHHLGSGSKQKIKDAANELKKAMNQ